MQTRASINSSKIFFGVETLVNVCSLEGMFASEDKKDSIPKGSESAVRRLFN